MNCPGCRPQWEPWKQRKNSYSVKTVWKSVWLQMTSCHMNEWLSNTFCLRCACELTTVSFPHGVKAGDPREGKGKSTRWILTLNLTCTRCLIAPFPRTTLGSKNHCCKVAHSECHSETTISSFQRVWLISILLVKQSIPYEITDILSRWS